MFDKTASDALRERQTWEEEASAVQKREAELKKAQDARWEFQKQMIKLENDWYTHQKSKRAAASASKSAGSPSSD